MFVFEFVGYLHTVEKSQFSSKIGEVTLKYILFHVHKYKVLIKNISYLIFSMFQENQLLEIQFKILKMIFLQCTLSLFGMTPFLIFLCPPLLSSVPSSGPVIV